LRKLAVGGGIILKCILKDMKTPNWLSMLSDSGFLLINSRFFLKVWNFRTDLVTSYSTNCITILVKSTPEQPKRYTQ
jgi:hypothetical protein